VAPALDEAAGRIRYAVGDVDDDAVLMPPFGSGGLAVYDDLLTQYEDDEAAAWRAAASALYAYYATLPTSIGTGGKYLVWTARLDGWKAAMEGRMAYPFAALAGETAAPLTFVPVTYRATDSTDEFDAGVSYG
jgi:hypothetical protein